MYSESANFISLKYCNTHFIWLHFILLQLHLRIIYTIPFTNWNIIGIDLQRAKVIIGWVLHQFHWIRSTNQPFKSNQIIQIFEKSNWIEIIRSSYRICIRVYCNHLFNFFYVKFLSVRVSFCVNHLPANYFMIGYVKNRMFELWLYIKTILCIV